MLQCEKDLLDSPSGMVVPDRRRRNELSLDRLVTGDDGEAGWLPVLLEVKVGAMLSGASLTCETKSILSDVLRFQVSQAILSA